MKQGEGQPGLRETIPENQSCYNILGSPQLQLGSWDSIFQGFCVKVTNLDNHRGTIYMQAGPANKVVPLMVMGSAWKEAWTGSPEIRLLDW